MWKNNALTQDEVREQKRMAVLSAGAALFNQQGFDRTSLDDIAKSLSVTKRTLYYYVKSKDEILSECNWLAIDFLEEPLATSKIADAPPLERMERLLRSYIKLLSTDFGACLVLSEERTLTEDSRLALHAAKKNFDLAVRALIKEAIADGTIAECDPKIAAATIFGAINWVPRWFQSADAADWDRLSTEMLAILLNGLRAAPPKL